MMLKQAHLIILFQINQYYQIQQITNRENNYYIMDQRHYSPDQIKTIDQPLQKQNSKMLRQGGSMSNLFSKKFTLLQQQSQTIGDYTFNRENMIGTGYTSKVYKCKHRKQQGQFAVKVIDLMKYSALSLQMLEHEIQILKMLDHPNIIKLKNVYRTANHCFLVTQYCSHGDLLEYITKQGKLGQNQAIFITGQIIKALKYLFKYDIIHRDIKPANIFKGNENWKLGDFGFAMRCQGQVKTKQNVGTPLYMPPQVLLRNSYSAQSDIFAIGVILYEMMAGFTPWQSKNQKQLLEKMNTLPFSIPDKIKVNTSVRYLMTKLCAINRDERTNKEQFLQLNLNNFTNLIYFDEINNQSDDYKNNNLHSNTKLLKQQNKHKHNEYLNNRYKLNCKSKQILQTQNSKIRINSIKKTINNRTYVSLSHRQSQKTTLSHKKLQLKQQQQRTYDILLSQLNYCRFMYYLIQNIKYVPIIQINRYKLSLILFKHLLKIIKKLADNKNNCYAFSNWDNLRKSQKYRTTFKTMRQYCQKYQKQYLIFLQKTQINIIKQINQKLPQFLSQQQQFSKIFYHKIQKFIIPFLKQSITFSTINNQSQKQQNLSKLQGIRSLYKYYQLLQINIKKYINYPYFCNNHGITVVKNYKKTKIQLNQYLPIKQAIKMLEG